MNKNIKLAFTLFLFSATTTLFSQEICDNGIDDDGDGRIDCYDGDCSSDGACDDFFFGNVVECADDIDVTTFAIRLQWASEDRSSNSHATPMVGDLDGNGIPEVIVTNKQRRSLFILNGATGATLFSNTTLGFQPENVPVIGDIDRDEFGEILVSQDQGDDMALLDNEANIIWTAKASRNDAIGLPGFADFDEDGDVEIYYRNEIVDATTGNVIVTGTNNDWERNFTHGSLAVDVLADGECADCAGLELISGNEIWSINEAAGTRTLVKDMDSVIQNLIDPLLNYYPKYYSNWDDQWSSVSAADYNLDGFMDLIITGALGTASETYQGETTIFFWDVENDNVITFTDPSNNFVRGPGRVNIGDVDGDGQLNANFVMNQKLYSLDENFNIHWIRPIKEGSSGFTGCSLFDFDGDGAVEVVYRSEESLLIVDGIGNGDNTTNIRNEIACVSRTQEEYPVIADVDGDGSSEICLACYTNNSTPFNPYSNTEFSQVRVYESDGEAWMPARGVWNQHAYYNVNINDDLTIPIEVQDHTVKFSDAGTCEYADGSLIPFDGRPLNTFINQAPILNENGCVEFASPDIEFVGILNATDAECPDATIEVTFEIRNIGDIAISGNLPVSYYAGDPRLATGSTLLDTEVSTLVNFEPETTIPLTQTITGIGGEFELFVVINDNGSTPPISVPLPTAAIPECDTENNIQSTNVGFIRFDLFSEKLNDNRKCDDTLPDNGSAHAYYFGVVPGESGTFWIENFEDNNNSDKSDTGETAWTSDAGTGGPSFYGVATYNSSKMFNGVKTGGANDAGEVTWVSEAIDISNHTDITATLDLFENGNQESSGQWRDYIIATYEIQDQTETVTASGEFINGRQFGNFDYAQAILTGVNNAGQNDSLLVITITIHNTSTSEFHYLDNVSVQGTPDPVPTIQTEADGFVFNWYNIGDTTNVIYTGSTISQLMEGDYIVEGFYGGTQCFSALDTVTIERTTPEVFVWAYEVSPETNCTLPDGSAYAFAYTTTEDGSPPPATGLNPPGDTLEVADGYQVNWRINGDVTNTIIATGNLIENKTAQDYAADITEDFTGCFSTALVTITSPIEAIQGLNASAININTCGGTGTVSADVNGNTTDYTFEWYDGPNVTASIDFTGITYTVSDPGDYTVVARDNTTGCTSNPETVTVGDDANAPVLNALETQGNSNCGSNPNGQARADVNGIVGDSGFDYMWFLGANTLPANELPGSVLTTATFGVGEWEMTGLLDGVYTIIVEETATNCTDTTTVTISDVSVEPTFITEDAVITPNTSCGAPNGIIETGAAITPSVSYAFSLYAGPTIDPDSLITTNSSGSFPGLEPKTYTIAAVDNTSECETAVPLTVTVGDEPDDPNIAASSNPDTFCINGNGTITVTSSANVVEPGSYTYEIFDGFSFTNEIVAKSDITVSNGATGHTFAGLEDGNYRIRVTNDNLDCDSYTDVVIGDAAVIPTFSASRLINDNTSCDAANPNGAISVSIDEVGFDASDYTWEWYQGSSADADFLLANPEAGEGASVTIDGYSIAQNALNNIAEGDYTVFARDNTTGCKTIDLTLTVNDVPYIPNVIIVQEEPQTDCDDGNGILRAYVDDPNLPCVECIESDGFSFQWQLDGVPIVDGGGALTNGSDNYSGAQTNTISGLISDEYTVTVRETNTDCPASSAFVLGENQHIPIISGVATPNTSCDVSSATGSITMAITNLDPDRTYTFQYTYSNASTVANNAIVNGSTTANLTGVVHDTYTVVATSDLGCASDPITVVVDQDPDRPDFEAAALNAGTENNTVCDPRLNTSMSYDGSVQVDVTDGSNLANYTINWFDGAGTGTPAAIGSVNGNRYEELPGGTYTAQIISTVGNQCDTTIQIQIINDTDDTYTNLDLDGDVSAVDDNSCIADNGQLVVDISSLGGSGDYNFKYYNGGSVLVTATDSIDISASGVVYNNLAPGDYTVVIVDNETGCATLPNTYTINAVPVTFTPAIIKDSDQTSCDLTNPNGQLAVDFGAFALGTSIGTTTDDFVFQWFRGQNTNPSNEIATGLNTDSSVVSGLSSGIYTLKVTDRESGCDETIEETIVLSTTDPQVGAGPTTQPNTSCITPNGQITIEVNNGGSGAVNDGANGYRFELFEGTTINPGDVPIQNITNNDPSPTTQVFTGLLEGDYIIRATDINTDCKVVSTVASVGYNGMEIEFDEPNFETFPITTCFSSNGFIDVTSTGGVTTITGNASILWYIGTDTSDINNTVLNQVGTANFLDDIDVNGTGFTLENSRIENLPAVVYTGVVTLANGCIRLIQTDLSQVDAPEMNLINPINPTRCETIFNGSFDIQLIANSGNSPSEYNYYVFEGARAILNDTDGISPYDPSLGGGTYDPVLVTAGFVDITADATEVIPITALEAGTYTVAIEIDIDKCITNVQTITLEDPTLPEITLDAGNTNNNTTCDSPAPDGSRFNGQISVNTVNPGVTPPGETFSYQWSYDADGDGDFSSGETNITSNGNDAAGAGSNVTGFDSNVLGGIGGGWYRVIATGDVTECEDILDIQIFDEPVDLSILTANVNKSDINDCGEQGSITINAITQSNGSTDYTSVAAIEAGFTINWFTRPTGYADPGSDASVADLIEGDYEIRFTENTTGCTLEYSFSIEDTAVNPTVRVASRDDDSFCDDFGTDFRGDGELDIAVREAGVDIDLSTTDYSVIWYRGNSSANPNDEIFPADPGGNRGTTAGASAELDQLTGLSAGQYTVVITKNSPSPNATCFVTSTFTINSVPPTLSVATSDIDAVDNFNCENPNGMITIEDVLSDGISVVTPGDYTFAWEKNGSPFVNGTDGTIADFGGFTGNRIEGLFGDTYTVAINNTATGCETGTIAITIEDNQVNPMVTLSSKTGDEFCFVDNQGNGTLSIDIFDNIAGTLTQVDNPTNDAEYIVEWYRGATVTSSADPEFLFDNQGNNNADGNIIGDASVGTDISELTGLRDGQYTVGITKVNTVAPNAGCDIVGTFSILSDEVIPIFDEDAVQARALPDTICDVPRGTIILENDDITGSLSDYDFVITGENTGVVNLVPFLPIASPWTLSNLAADNYRIDATNNTTGCEIATGIVNIADEIENPLVTLVSLTADQSCPPGITNAGEIVVVVDGIYDHTNTRYTFLWTEQGGGALPVVVADDEATLSGIPGGNYQVTVTNNNTGCDVTRVYEVPNVSLLPNITQVDIEAKTNCTPDNGSFELLQVTYDGDTYAAGGANEIDGVFELTIFRTSDDVQQGLVSNVPYTVGNLSPDDYYAVVTHIVNTCESEPYNFTIDDDPDLPLVELTLNQADSTCQTGFSPNASVTALANGENHTNADYSFQWYFGAAADIGGSAVILDGTPLANGSIPVGFDESTISGLAAGLYTVEVSQTSNGCIVTKQINIPTTPAEVAITSLDVIGSTDCFGNGVIDITGVTKNGISDNPANYIFEFYTANPENAGATPVFTVPTDGAIFNTALGATTYFVVGTHAELGCVTPATQTTVQENIDRPVVELDDFDFQTNCDPDNPNGRFLVLADGQPDNTDYDFQWFIGTTTADSLTSDDYQGGQNLTGENTNEVFGLAAGFYTVVALNNITGCTTAKTYEMTDLTPDDLEIATSVSDNTNCDEPNGIVSASVIMGQNLEDEVGVRAYNYYWFIGTLGFWGNSPDTLQASFRGQTITDLPQGNYVVLAVDKSDGYCNSIARQVNIDDDPILTAYEIETRDVTVCFDDKDGYAEVITNDLSQVNITWKNDMNDSIGSGFFIDSLDAGLYSVTVTNRITQCPNTKVFEIFNNAVTPSDPSVIVTNGRNNCSFANGSAVANVDGVTNNYLFEWFDPNDLVNPYATGFQVNNLDTITYLVRATDITTGCSSGFTQVEIDYEQQDPIFRIEIENSICLRTEDGSTNQFTGSAVIVFEEFNLPLEYEWTYLGDDNFQTEEVISRDSRLIDAFPGNYRVRFIAENGCEYTANFILDVTLNIYNGVSANDDGKNDFFLIDCIDYFPQNNVKIFNRAGQRIYEVNGYDNRSVRFEGTSNVGGGGLVLPSGTYFYLVDLGTGEDPIQGYLELVR